ncbi:hypothetical protein ACJX0J_028904, partial [Zea mays]
YFNVHKFVEGYTTDGNIYWYFNVHKFVDKHDMKENIIPIFIYVLLYDFIYLC